MQIWELFIIAVGLSMDAFAVAVCKGLSVRKVSPGHALTAGLYFGGFQALMPLLGYFLGTQFESLIQSVDHWIAFALLGLIGANMIRESRSESEEFNDSFLARRPCSRLPSPPASMRLPWALRSRFCRCRSLPPWLSSA